MSVFKWLTPEGRIYQAMRKLVLLPWLVIILAIGQITVWAMDRKPPFALLSAEVNSPRPGEQLMMSAKVRRDLHRDCSVVFSRYLFDSIGVRYDLSGQQVMGPDAIRNMNALAPGELNLIVRIPETFRPGPAVFSTVLEYRCNPLQDLVRPIHVQMHVVFEVRP
jgi:hypothetical protein